MLNCRGIRLIDLGYDIYIRRHLFELLQEFQMSLSSAKSIEGFRRLFVRSDDGDHPLVESERFVGSCSVESHATAARPSPMLGVFGIHDNSGVIFKNAAQMLVIDDDHMIQALATNASVTCST
jgi:hypothetical protein